MIHVVRDSYYDIKLRAVSRCRVSMLSLCAAALYQEGSSRHTRDWEPFAKGYLPKTLPGTVDRWTKLHLQYFTLIPFEFGPCHRDLSSASWTSG